MKIEYVSTGLANNFGDTIELNENLLKYPELHYDILSHEYRHTDKLFTLHDLQVDLTEHSVNPIEVLKFMFRYPKSFTQLLPFYFSKKHGFVYDINLTLIYVICLIIISTGFFLGKII